MSECQYYEFQAVDQPLTEKQIEELPSYLTRARKPSFIGRLRKAGLKG